MLPFQPNSAIQAKSFLVSLLHVQLAAVTTSMQGINNKGSQSRKNQAQISWENFFLLFDLRTLIAARCSLNQQKLLAMKCTRPSCVSECRGTNSNSPSSYLGGHTQSGWVKLSRT
jgi:hypothetical protein